MEDIESPNYRYERWAGNNKGYAQKPDKCVQSVYSGGSYISSQCKRKRVNGLYWKQHTKKDT